MSGFMREYWGLYRAVRSYSRRRKLPLLRFVAKAVEEKLDYEQTARCLSCDSADIEYRSGDYATGVVAPDGGREYRFEEWVECRRCGAREDVPYFDRIIKERLA